MLRTGRMVDTSPPIWELRSAHERRNVYERQRVGNERFRFCDGFARMRVFTVVNDQVLVGALGVNMLTANAFMNCCNIATGGSFAENHA